MKIDIVIPTIGRQLLDRAARSALSSMTDAHHLYIVGDGPQAAAQKIVEDIDDPRIIYKEIGPTKDWGASQIEWAMNDSKADFMANIGDDDYFLPRAITTIESVLEDWEVAGGDPTVHAFAVWHEEFQLEFNYDLTYRWITGQQIVYPLRGRRGKWIPQYGNDFVYLKTTLEARHLVAPVWHRHRISVLEANNSGKSCEPS